MKKILFLVVATGISTSSLLAQSDVNETAKRESVQGSLYEAAARSSNGGVGSFTSFSSKEDTKGMRYAYNKWVKGTVLDTANQLYDNPQYGFNYDKITHSIYLKAENNESIQLNPDLVKEFSLKNDDGVATVYTRVAAINPDAFVSIIGDNRGVFVAYKLVVTSFEKANYHSDGLTESGHNYDEFKDKVEYYIGKTSGVDFKKIELTKKSIKKAIGANPKADAFFASHKTDDVDENFVRALVENLNK